MIPTEPLIPQLLSSGQNHDHTAASRGHYPSADQWGKTGSHSCGETLTAEEKRASCRLDKGGVGPVHAGGIGLTGFTPVKGAGALV